MTELLPELPVKIHFDLTMFPVICGWLFDSGKRIFEMLNFDFLGYTLNGWSIMIGLAVVFMVVDFIARILQ